MKTAYEYTKERMQVLKPSKSYNGVAFENWKAESREILSNLLGMDKFDKADPKVDVEYEKDTEDGVEIRFTFQSEEGYRVPCHLLLPEGVSNPPVMICLQGHSKGMHVSLGRIKFSGDEVSIFYGDEDFCRRGTKEGFATVAIEQRNFGECGGSEKGPDCLASTVTTLLTGRTTIGERVWDVMRLIDVLETEFQDKMDLSTICCVGNSGGGTATAYLAALEDRIVLAMPSCAMCTFKDSIGGMPHCSCNYVPRIAEYFDMNDLMAMAYPKYFIQVSGILDPIFPIQGAKEVFEKGKEIYVQRGHEDRCTLVQGDYGHRFYADDAWPVVHQYIGR